MNTIQKLFHQVRMGNIQYVKEYVKSGDDINVEGDYRWKIGHEAAWHGHLNILQYWHEKGGNLDALVSGRKTIADIARFNFHENCVNYYNLFF